MRINGHGYVGVPPGTTTMAMSGCVPGFHGGANSCPPDPFWELVQTPLKLPWGPGDHGLPSSVVPSGAAGVLVPYGSQAEMNGWGLADATPGPFGMPWFSFLGVIAIAVAGGVGLGYLSLRR